MIYVSFFFFNLGLWGVGIEAAVYKHTIAAYFL